MEKSFVAIRSLHRESPLVREGNLAFDQAPPGGLTGLILEADRRSRYDSPEHFMETCLGRTHLNRGNIGQDSLIYRGLDGTVIAARYEASGTFTEPVYDWGYGPVHPVVIPATPPFRQPEWPGGEGHGRIPSWKVNGVAAGLEGSWPVYGGPGLHIGGGLLEMQDLEGNSYRVDYTGRLPLFSMNGNAISNP